MGWVGGRMAGSGEGWEEDKTGQSAPLK